LNQQADYSGTCSAWTLRRQAIAIADRLLLPAEQRSHIRTKTAMALKRQLQFDEADRLEAEAAAIAKAAGIAPHGRADGPERPPLR
jgi:hypothetical protein